jgi:hypothetical protein
LLLNKVSSCVLVDTRKNESYTLRTSSPSYPHHTTPHHTASCNICHLTHHTTPHHTTPHHYLHTFYTHTKPHRATSYSQHTMPNLIYDVMTTSFSVSFYELCLPYCQSHLRIDRSVPNMGIIVCIKTNRKKLRLPYTICLV